MYPSSDKRYPHIQRSLDVPVVMAFSGLDPGGGGGLQADIEAIASQGCHTAPLTTALTVQDTVNVYAVQSCDARLLRQQAEAVLNDTAVSAFKVGLLADVEVVEAVHHIVAAHTEVPLVVDPVLRAGGGAPLGDARITDALLTLLLPHTTVLTPNVRELRQLAPDGESLAEAAQQLLREGCEFVLATGADEDTAEVVNRLYAAGQQPREYRWERLPGQYHGSGCTLAAAIAGRLALGKEPLAAILEAQEYTWHALRNAYGTGQGQRIPDRMFWGSGPDR